LNVNNTVQFFNCEIDGAVLLQNVNTALLNTCITGFFASGAFTLVSDASQPTPAGFFGSYALIECCSLDAYSTIAINGPTGGGEIDLDVGTILGNTSGTMTIQSGQLVRSFAGSTVSCNVTIQAGGEFRSIGGTTRGTVTNSGTYTQQGTTIAATLQAATHE